MKIINGRLFTAIESNKINQITYFYPKKIIFDESNTAF
jgi:hypothetical protein